MVVFRTYLLMSGSRHGGHDGHSGLGSGLSHPHGASLSHDPHRIEPESNPSNDFRLNIIPSITPTNRTAIIGTIVNFILTLSGNGKKIVNLRNLGSHFSRHRYILIQMATTTLLCEIEDLDIQALYKHNCNSGNSGNSSRSDSGLDLFMPTTLTLPAKSTTLVDLGLRCELLNTARPHGYFLYPRSSIYKTPMRLANSVGIIDFGYRGSLKVAIDNRGDVPYEIKSGERFFQLCLPNLVPFDIQFGKVSLNTERGEGGFGSTNSPSVTTVTVAVARQLTGSSTDGEIELFKN